MLFLYKIGTSYLFFGNKLSIANDFGVEDVTTSLAFVSLSNIVSTFLDLVLVLSSSSHGALCVWQVWNDNTELLWYIKSVSPGWFTTTRLLVLAVYSRACIPKIMTHSRTRGLYMFGPGFIIVDIYMYMKPLDWLSHIYAIVQNNIQWGNIWTSNFIRVLSTKIC